MRNGEENGMHGGRECRGEHEKTWRETHRTRGGDVEEGQKDQERERRSGGGQDDNKQSPAKDVLIMKRNLCPDDHGSLRTRELNRAPRQEVTE